MARIDPLLSATQVARIAGPHQSTVTTILRAVELGLFTAAQAELMIDRVRAHLTALPIATPITLPLSVADSVPAMAVPIAWRLGWTDLALAATTPTPPAPATAYFAARLAAPPECSGSSRSSAGSSPCGGPTPFDSPRITATTDPTEHTDAHHEGMRS